MSLTITQAKDEIYTQLNGYWNLQVPLSYLTPVKIYWMGIDYQTPPDASQPWARVTLQHNYSNQTTFAQEGTRRFTRTGLLIVQLFVPLASKNVTLCEKLGIIARDAFEGKATAGGVWFRNANLREIGADGTWYQFNMSVEFQYDEFK